MPRGPLGSYAGAVVGMPVSGILTDVIGWEACFYFYGEYQSFLTCALHGRHFDWPGSLNLALGPLECFPRPSSGHHLTSLAICCPRN